MPFGIAETLGSITEMLNKLLLGPAGRIRLHRGPGRTAATDNVVSEQAIAEGRTLAGLGLTPESVEAIVPTYLYRYRKTGQFADKRAA